MLKSMLEKLLKNKNLICLTFTFFLVQSFQVVNCGLYEILFLPFSAEETMLMQFVEVLSEGSGSVGNNPAGCGMENKKSFSFGYTHWQMQENLYSLGLFLPQNFANLGFKLQYADFGETELVSEIPIDVKKEKLYSTIFNTSLGKEFFFPGLFLGIDLGLGSVKLDKNLNLISNKIGFVYVLNFPSTELHLGGIVGINFCDTDNLGIYGFGIKYFIPEYRTFVNIAYNKNVYSFITGSFEVEMIKNFGFVLGYETSNEKSLTNYSLGVKFGQKNFDIVLATRYNTELSWTISATVVVRN